jgi:hypothetical protein
VIDVHIHPLISEMRAGLRDPRGDNQTNTSFSPRGAEGSDAFRFSEFSRRNGIALHAAVIGSDGSISYAAGGSTEDAYERPEVVRVAPRRTIPMWLPANTEEP